MKMTFYIILCGFLLAGCGTDTTMEHEMFGANNSTKKFVIASPVEGVLLQGGKPLTDTRITRRLRWNGNDDGILQEFFTDARGKFSLPVHEEELELGMTQFVSSSKLESEINGKVYDLWYSNKFDEDLHAETDGEILEDLICDIEEEEVSVEYDLSGVTTLCRWKNMPDPE